MRTSGTISCGSVTGFLQSPHLDLWTPEEKLDGGKMHQVSNPQEVMRAVLSSQMFPRLGMKKSGSSTYPPSTILARSMWKKVEHGWTRSITGGFKRQQQSPRLTGRARSGNGRPAQWIQAAGADTTAEGMQRLPKNPDGTTRLHLMLKGTNLTGG